MRVHPIDWFVWYGVICVFSPFLAMWITAPKKDKK